MPLPLPVEPLVMVIHPALVAAVQLQPAAAVTVTIPEPAADVRLADPGEIVGRHVTPAWFTVRVLPPTDTVPVRAAVPAFVATVYESEPLPVPVAPVVIVIHALLLVVVQPQPVAALTVTTPEAPDEATVADVGEIAETQVAPACVTVKVLPPIVSVPVRDDVVVFAATS